MWALSRCLKYNISLETQMSVQWHMNPYEWRSSRQFSCRLQSSFCFFYGLGLVHTCAVTADMLLGLNCNSYGSECSYSGCLMFLVVSIPSLELSSTLTLPMVTKVSADFHSVYLYVLFTKVIVYWHRRARWSRRGCPAIKTDR